MEEDLFEKYIYDFIVWRNDEVIFNIEKKVLMLKFKLDIWCNKDYLVINERFKELFMINLKVLVRFKFLFNDVIFAVIKVYFCGYWWLVGIMFDEVGIIFNGYIFNELLFINKMWDGLIFMVERKNEFEKLIRDVRIILLLMV